MIEWEQPDDEMAAAQQRDAAGGFADQEVRHWDVVEEASDESFPASDPPAWGSSHAAPTAQSASEVECGVQAAEPFGWARRHVRAIAIGLAALGALLGIQRMRRHAA